MTVITVKGALVMIAKFADCSLAQIPRRYKKEKIQKDRVHRNLPYPTQNIVCVIPTIILIDKQCQNNFKCT